MFHIINMNEKIWKLDSLTFMIGYFKSIQKKFSRNAACSTNNSKKPVTLLVTHWQLEPSTLQLAMSQDLQKYSLGFLLVLLIYLILAGVHDFALVVYMRLCGSWNERINFTIQEVYIFIENIFMLITIFVYKQLFLFSLFCIRTGNVCYA